MSIQYVSSESEAYTLCVPKLWSETIQTHRREVNEAILETTAALVTEHGLRGVSMSQIAERTGISRATLYKYFSDVEAILFAWHDRHVSDHLAKLIELANRTDSPYERLRGVVDGYGLILYEIAREHRDGDLVALVHRGDHHARAEHQLDQLILGLVVEAVDSGEVRNDVAADELVAYCTYSLLAASALTSTEAVHRLAAVILAGLRPNT
jgi:AcrR family transcriptional regulator